MMVTAMIAVNFCILFYMIQESHWTMNIIASLAPNKVLSTALEGLFKWIYTQTKLPAQWLVSKTIPIYKNKGERKDVEIYWNNTHIHCYNAQPSKLSTKVARLIRPSNFGSKSSGKFFLCTENNCSTKKDRTSLS